MVATVCAIMEIIHTFTVSDLDHVIFASKLYARLFLDRDSFVSFACKQALIRALRPRARRKRVFIPSPPQCHSPGRGSLLRKFSLNLYNVSLMALKAYGLLKRCGICFLGRTSTWCFLGSTKERSHSWDRTIDSVMARQTPYLLSNCGFKLMGPPQILGVICL